MKLFSSKLKSKTDFYTQIALILVIVLLVNLVFAFAPFRFDITQAQIYSISKVTKQTLKELDDIITIKAYFTKDLPGYLITVRQQVKDILSEYKNYGSGNIKIKFLNPNENPKIEQEAKALGLPPLQFNVVKKDKFEVAQGYLGIAILYGDKTETIPVVQDTSTLEYDLTAAIKKLISGKELTIGIAQKQDALMSKQDLDLMQQILSKQYHIQTIDLKQGNLISDNINTLIIPGPKGEFSQRELYIIDQFIMSGHAVLIAVNGVEVEQGLIARPNEANIFDLLKSYGITINQNLIYDPRYNAQASFSKGFMTFFVPYGFWPKILPDGFNKENILVNKLESLVLPWVSSISYADKSADQILVSTSPESKIMKDNFNLDPQGFPQVSGEGNYAVAISIKGKLKSYFDKPVATNHPEQSEGSQNASALPQNDIKKETDNARLVVISDADLLSSGFIRRYNDNLVFLQNLIDGLTLDESLAAIRSKSVTERPITQLDDTTRGLVKYGNMIGVPFLVIIFAVMRFVWRRKSQRVGSEI